MFGMAKPRILFCGYRKWALDIINAIAAPYKDKIDAVIIKSKDEYDEKIKDAKPELAFFIGWSWIIKDEIPRNVKKICLHPSPLPRYRGGSPLQHQIINGEKDSAVTYFIMDDAIDAGPILWQQPFSLDGGLDEVFGRLTELGKKGLKDILDKYLATGKLDGKKQDESEATSYKRRTPKESEIKTEDFKNFTSRQIYDKIRALQDPYPNAFVVCKDGTKLYLQKAKTEEEKE